ncbi:DUF305 domain-containing protein [Arthrobacter sp. H5]|uniref:DUF305 domain-containing protein n=1 Tax=Arthrobacter sp. H5 TaxID=1267973 RepID=UPI0004B03D41|nr:DUF305 domain-containing protein [Arthrobacter sp. H5]
MEGAEEPADAQGMMAEEKVAELDAADGAGASRLFLSGMIEHHEGAVDMARQQIDGGADPQAIELAENIVATQQAEIDEMNALLSDL